MLLSRYVPGKMRPRPLPDDFFHSVWAKRPMLLKGHFAEVVAEANWRERFKSWCGGPVRPRLFATGVGDNQNGDDVRVPSSAIEAYGIFEQFAGLAAPMTLLLNRAEQADPELRRLRSCLGVGREWRHDDIVATLSTSGSGIGYHAGHEDGFIVQLSGRRRWRLWDETRTSREYRLKLLGAPQFANVSVPPSPGVPHDHCYDIEAGDALYLPSLFGHEGVTLEHSVALSIAWKGVTPYHLVTAALGKDSVTDRSISDIGFETWFKLLDSDERSEALVQALASMCKDCFRMCTGDDRQRVMQYIRTISARVDSSI